VIAQKPGWVKVRLATRPNGSTAWLRSAHLTFSQTPYRIVVNLSTKHVEMLVFRARRAERARRDRHRDRPHATRPVLRRLLRAVTGTYGPFILVTSAHSDAIADWEGSGDAVIGIHGPLGADIGSSGVAVSHGCIRLPIDDLVRLAGLPAGTPITIAA
jgi:hypothetical protein